MKKLFISFAALCLVASVYSCRETEKKAEDAMDATEEAVEEAMDATEDAMEETKDAMEEAVDSLGDAVEKTMEEVEGNYFLKTLQKKPV